MFDNDPIRFSMKSNRTEIAWGQPIELTITAQYLNLSPALLYTLAGSSGFRLKLLLPEGFIRTGGDYADLVSTELSPSNTFVRYTVTGYFTQVGAESTFRLLRSHSNADQTSLFVEKAHVSLTLINSVEPVSNRQARASAGNPANGNYEGNCDGGHCENLWGWVYDRNNPNTPIIIEMLANGQVVGTLTAAEFRQDLVNAGKGNGQHGFGFALPVSVKNGQSQSLSLRVQGSNYILPNSTRTLTCGGSGTTTTNPGTTTPPPTNNPSNGNYEGHFEGADCGNLGGWVYDRNNPNAPITVEVVSNGQVVGSFSAANFRQDLLNAGKGNGQHGFNYVPPASIKNGQNQSISLRVHGSSFTLEQGPRTIQCAGSGSSGGTTTPPTNPGTTTPPPSNNPSNGNYEGNFEGADCGNLGGWVYDRNNPNAPITVEVVANGQVVGSFSAANFRQDLLNAGKGNGQHGFNYAPPASIKNGQNQSISLRVQGSSYTLNNSPKTIQCAGSGNNGGNAPNPPTNGCGTGTGLTGYYSNGINFANNPTRVRTDASINFSWGGSPFPGAINDDNFNVYWAGQIEAPVTGNYTFKTNNDDGTKLSINGQLIIDDWTAHGPVWQQGTIYLTAGQKYRIELFFYESSGGAQAQLFWEYPGKSLEIVPTCRLYPTTKHSGARQIYNDSRWCLIEYFQLGCAILETCGGEVQRIYREEGCADQNNEGTHGGPNEGTDGDGDPLSPFPYNPQGTTTPNIGGGQPLTNPASAYASTLTSFYRRAQFMDVFFTDDEKALLAVDPALGESVMAYTDHYQQKAPIDQLIFRSQLNISGYSELGQAPFEYGPGLPVMSQMLYVFKVSREFAVLKAQNPGWSDYKCLLVACKNVTTGTLHFILDVAGLVPGAGELSDAINGGIYLLEGNNTDAALSFAATLPIGGWAATGGKWAKNGLQYVGDGLFKSTEGLIWSSRTYFTDNESLHALNHTYLHFKNNLDKDYHSVFTVPTNELISLTDEAWAKIKNNYPGITITTNGNPTYVVPMERKIGYQGGKKGSGADLDHIRIIIDRNNPGHVVTAHPY